MGFRDHALQSDPEGEDPIRSNIETKLNQTQVYNNLCVLLKLDSYSLVIKKIFLFLRNRSSILYSESHQFLSVGRDLPDPTEFGVEFIHLEHIKQKV